LFDLLSLLIQSKSQQVSREQLINEVWQGRVVSESAINRAISMLRKAFQQLDPTVDYIETLPKVGYRLLPRLNINALQCDAVIAESAAGLQDKSAPTVSELELPNNNARSITTIARFISFSAKNVLLTVLVIGVFAGLTLLLSRHHQPEKTQWLTVIDRPVNLTHSSGSEYGITGNQQTLFYRQRVAEQTASVWQYQTSAELIPQINATSPDHRIGSMALSPNGQWLVFAEYSANQCQLILLTLNQNKRQTLGTCMLDSEFSASWQADSKAFYFRERQNKTYPYAIYRYIIATGQRQQLTLPAADNIPGALLIASAPIHEQTDQLAVLRYIDTNRSELSLLQGPKWLLQPVAEIPMNVRNLQWVTADLLVFSSDKTLYQYHLSTRQFAKLYQANHLIESFWVSANSISFAELQLQSSIWQIYLPTKQRQLLVNTPSINNMPRSRSTDQRLFFLTNRSGHYQIWQQQQGRAQFLSELPEADFTRLSLSSDQRSLVYSQLGAVYQLDLDSGKQSKLLPIDVQAHVVSLDNQSNSLVFSSQRSGDWQLWQYQLPENINDRVQSSQPILRQLTQDGGYSGIMHDNQLYFTRYHRSGLWRKTLPDGPEELLIADVDVTNWLNWQLTKNTIYFYRPQSGIWQYDISTQNEQLVMAKEPGFIHQFHLSGDWLYFVRREPTAGDIYRVELTNSIN